VNYFGYGSSKSPSQAQGYCQSIGGNLASFVSQDDIDRIISVIICLTRAGITGQGLSIHSPVTHGALSTGRILHSPCQ
jgi:hypothetical protein